MKTKTTGIRSALGSLTFGAVVASGFAETYTVSTDSGTYDAPVAIETLTVGVGSGGEKTFAEMIAALKAGDVLIKEGAGFVASSDALKSMASTSSEIRIEEGAFVISNTNHLGLAVSGSAPKVTVAEDATLLLKGNVKFRTWNRFTFAGNGVDAGGTIGRLGAFCMASSKAQEDTFFSETITLAGDTEFYNKSGNRLDFYPGTQNLQLNGHRLKLRGSSTFCWSGVYVTPGETGGITVDHMALRLQGGSTTKTWEGSTANTLVFTNAANYAIYNNCVRLPWTVVWNSSGQILNSGSKDYANPWNVLTVNCFDGPVRIDSPRMRLYAGPTPGYQRGFVMNGPVSGVGGFYAQLMLHLNNDGNTFEGPVAAVAPESSGNYGAAGVCLYKPGALPLNDQPLALTNALARMADDEVFHLRRVEAHVGSDAVTNNYLMGGAAGGTVAALRKTGPAAFEYRTPMAVTGTVELAEGMLRLPPTKRQYSLAPGLWTGKWSTNDEHVVFATSAEANAWARKYMDATAATFSNSVDSCTAKLYGPSTCPPWELYEVVTWTGYLWNRSATNENWTFALRMNGYAKLWLNGEGPYTVDDNQNIATYRLALKPGPNHFVYKACPRGNIPAGAASLPARSGKSTAWPTGWGLSVDCLGRAASGGFADIANYERMMNDVDGTAVTGGDGFWFTLDERDVTAFTEEELMLAARGNVRKFARLAAKPGTTLDLGEGNWYPYALPELVGLTAVTNGGLRVTGSWTVPVSQVVAGGKLAVDGALSFADGATIAVDEDVKPTTHDFVVAEAKDGITMPAGWQPGEIGDDGFKRRYALRLSLDGKQLILGVRSRGLQVIVR